MGCCNLITPQTGVNDSMDTIIVPQNLISMFSTNFMGTCTGLQAFELRRYYFCPELLPYLAASTSWG